MKLPHKGKMVEAPLHHHLLTHLHRLSDRLTGKIPSGAARRSPLWYGVEKKHREIEPDCIACASDKALNVHHVLPYHLHPEDELKQRNLVTLCRICHLLIGHLRNWHSFNIAVKEYAVMLLKQIKHRPKG